MNSVRALLGVSFVSYRERQSNRIGPTRGNVLFIFSAFANLLFLVSLHSRLKIKPFASLLARLDILI